MRMMFLTAGSRGDVDPFVALARRAQSAGHDVRVAVTRDFVGHVRAGGLDAIGLDGDYSALVAGQGASPWAAVRSFRTVIRPMMAAFLRSAADAALGYRPDVLVHHPKVLSAPLAAARLGIPHVLVEIVPTITPTRQFPAAGCVAAVHHGGSGTAHAAVRAGVVSVCVPFLADQPFWGALLHRRGFGAAPMPAHRRAARCRAGRAARSRRGARRCTGDGERGRVRGRPRAPGAAEVAGGDRGGSGLASSQGAPGSLVGTD